MGERFFFQIGMNSAASHHQLPRFALPGAVWRSAGNFWCAEFTPPARWTVATGAMLGSAYPDDGAAERLVQAAQKVWTGAGSRLLITAGSGCAGRGDLSTAAAQGFAHAAAERLGIAESNLLFASAGPVFMHFPVGEELRRLERAMSAQKTSSPEGPGADSVSIPFRLTDGAVAVSAARFFAPNPGFGSMVWMAGIDADVGRPVLEDMARPLWLAGPEALRARTGPVPGDVLLLFSTAVHHDNPVMRWEDPRRAPLEAALSAALGVLARRAGAAIGALPCVLEGADSAQEAVHAARRLAPALVVFRCELLELAESDRPRVLSEFLRSVLLTTGIAGFERTPVSVRIANALLNEGLRQPEQSGANIEAVHAWLEGSEELSIHLGRGRLGFRFWA